MGRYRVAIGARAEQDLLKVPFPTRRQLNHRIMSFQKEPRPKGWEELGPAGKSRLLLHGYRLLYRIDESERLVIVYALRGPEE